MIDVEKVISDLQKANRLVWNGEHCDIMDSDDALTVSYAIVDAIAALKAQEPRVLTLEELQSIGKTWDKNTPPYLWVEILDAPEWYTDDKMWVPYSFIRDTINVGSEKYNKDNYLKRWRCWTSKPTDEQRKNTLWMEGD